MTLWEVICAMWMLSTVSTSATFAWATASAVLDSIRVQQIVNDCAEDTAERLFARVTPLSNYVVDGNRCYVEVIYHQGPNHAQTHIVSSCGSVTDELWIGEN